MTQTELYNHILVTLMNHGNHTIVRHKKQSGELCWRIRDSSVTPIANFSDGIFDLFQNNNLLTKLNEREWQLNTIALAELKKKR